MAQQQMVGFAPMEQIKVTLFRQLPLMTVKLTNYLKFQVSGGGNRKSTYSLGQTISGQYTIEYEYNDDSW